MMVEPQDQTLPAEPPSRAEIREAQRAERQAAKDDAASVVARFTGDPMLAYEEGIKAQDIKPDYWQTLSEAQREQVRRSQVYEMVQD